MPEIGQNPSFYSIVERIEKCGMGEVWEARNTHPGRIVAIKKVKEQHSERFKQEARAASGEPVEGVSVF
jgi:serine/threonine protein kinase